MKIALSSISAFVVFSTLAAAWADEVKPKKTVKSEKTVKPVAVKSLEQAKSLAPGTTSVSVHYTYQMHKADLFTGIMTTLAHNPRIRHLTLRLPNSSHVKDKTLDVLRKFQSLETLELFDNRDFPAPSIFEQVVATKTLKQVKFTFR